ncbi:MAG: hypothetical protein IJY99_00250 [Alphaproteobacteria bacterium]|nr:hypothetical protein [Alphaproteobacteria bacterium]
MKKVKKVIKCDSNMVCYTRSQRIRGYIAFVGLLACGVMIGWGFGSEPAKKISSGNDDVLILSSDKIDLTGTKVGQYRENPIKITAKKPIWIKSVVTMGQPGDNVNSVNIRSNCEEVGRIDSEHGCGFNIFFVPDEESAVETKSVSIRWEDEYNNAGESFVEVNYSAKGYTRNVKDCIEKEELMLASLPDKSEYDSLADYHRARVGAYRTLCSFCLYEAERYCRQKLDAEESKAHMLNEVKNKLENIR